MTVTSLLQAFTVVLLVSTSYCRQLCYSCGYNDHPTQKRGIECVSDPRNASVNWGIRCLHNCYYTTTVIIAERQLLSIFRGCAEDIGPNGCSDHGTQEVCRYSCSGDWCNGGLSGVLVDDGSTGGAVSDVMDPVKALLSVVYSLLIIFYIHARL